MPNLRFIDIGINLTDPVFRGVHRGSKKHPDDLHDVLKRAIAAGVKSMIITGGSVHESREALKLAEALGIYATAGCHPTRSAEFDKFKDGPEAYLAALDKLISSRIKGKGRVVAIGECGLDYDRLHFADKDTQRRHFRSQLSLAKKYHLPLFLHSRAAHGDFVQILREEGFGTNGGRDVGARGGVVHSFTGVQEEVEELASMGFHFSVNGCGLKTKENLAAAKSIPLDRLLVETDAPWCSMNATHASSALLASLPAQPKALFFPPSSRPERFVAGQAVKGRNEPSAIGGVAWVLAQLHGESLQVISEAAWKNTIEVFGLDDLVDMKVDEPEPEPESESLKPAFDIKNEEWPSL